MLYQLSYDRLAAAVFNARLSAGASTPYPYARYTRIAGPAHAFGGATRMASSVVL